MHLSHAYTPADHSIGQAVPWAHLQNMHAYTHIQTHTHEHTHMHTYTHTHTHNPSHTYTYTHTCTHAHTHTIRSSTVIYPEKTPPTAPIYTLKITTYSPAKDTDKDRKTNERTDRQIDRRVKTHTDR